MLCHANVARSVAAAQFLSSATDELGVVVEVRSAGTHATEGQPASSRTRAALDELGDGGGLEAHRAHLLAPDDVAWADLIIAMEGSQVRFVRRTNPEGAERAGTIAQLASDLPCDARPLAERVASLCLETQDIDDADDVADPAGGDQAIYAATTSLLRELCGELAVRLAG